MNVKAEHKSGAPAKLACPLSWLWYLAQADCREVAAVTQLLAWPSAVFAMNRHTAVRASSVMLAENFTCKISKGFSVSFGQGKQSRDTSDTVSR